MKKKMIFSSCVLLLIMLMACQDTETPAATPASSIDTPSLESSGGEVDDCVNPISGYPATGYPVAGYPSEGANCLAPGVSAAYPGAQPALAESVVEEWHAEVLPPLAGNATVTGVVMSEKSQKPVVAVPVFLAEVYYEGDSGAFVLDGAFSPQSVTDSDGRFAIVDIPAGDYVLVIGNPEVNDYKIITDESGKARVWTASPDNILDMSVIEVDLQLWQ